MRCKWITLCSPPFVCYFSDMWRLFVNNPRCCTLTTNCGWFEWCFAWRPAFAFLSLLRCTLLSEPFVVFILRPYEWLTAGTSLFTFFFPELRVELNTLDEDWAVGQIFYITTIQLTYKRFLLGLKASEGSLTSLTCAGLMVNSSFCPDNLTKTLTVRSPLYTLFLMDIQATFIRHESGFPPWLCWSIRVSFVL